MIFLPIIHRHLFSKELYRLEQLPQSTENHLKQTQSLHHQTLTQYEGSNLRIIVDTLKLDHLLCEPFSYKLIPAKAQLLQGDDDTVYTQTTSKFGIWRTSKRRNSSIVSDPILEIWGHLRSANSASFYALQNQILKLFGYT